MKNQDEQLKLNAYVPMITKEDNQKVLAAHRAMNKKLDSELQRVAHEEQEKRLAAAAPDLLAVCEAFAAPKLGALVATTGLGDQLRAAIAKARGA